ncbi:MAG: hypothetical protein GY811_31340 [Myxococcales bacterium]|nr:hypothetical protein [Myxococcales bacterium]
MSVVRVQLGVIALVVLLVPTRSQAQDENKAPFYEADPESKAEKKKTGLSGSVTSSTFFFTESGGNDGGAIPLESASPTDRIFTDLRLQLDAKHIGGGKLDFKFDFRGRKQLERCKARLTDMDPETECKAAQSGTWGGDELHLREAHLTYRGEHYYIGLGRQVMPEVASVRFDGVRVEQHKGESWKYAGFAGLYPTRGARDVRSDYPSVPSDITDSASATTRLLPVVAGAGGSYRKERIYGAVGLAGILPRGDEASTGLSESARVFLTSNGYWQQSGKTDIYHYIVFDVAGSQGVAITNVSLGASHRPTSQTRLFVRVNRVDTETLNVHAQQRLDPLDPMASAPIQNKWYVARVAQESGELGGTASFSQNRFAVSASGTVRRRPEITLVQTDETLLLLPLAQALDIQLQLVDRHSLKDFRIGVSVNRSSGLGEENLDQSKSTNLDRSKSTYASLDLSRDFAGGKGEFEVNLNYLKATDQSLSFNCTPTEVDFQECFGTSDTTSLGASGVVFYRPKRNWFAMGMIDLAHQSQKTGSIVAGERTAQPAVLMVTAFLRLAYRF